MISKVLDEAPKGDFSDRIDVFLSPVGTFSRKNISILKELYIGKIFYYLNQQVNESLTKGKTPVSKIKNKVLTVYKYLATPEILESVTDKLKNVSDEDFVSKVKSGKWKFYFVIPPFKDVSFEQIKKAADFIEIPLEENVYMPELKMWTTEKVPVGVSYYQFLEHHSDIYASVRGSEKYQSLSGQPTKGKSRLGGQSIGF